MNAVAWMANTTRFQAPRLKTATSTDISQRHKGGEVHEDGLGARRSFARTLRVDASLQDLPKKRGNFKRVTAHDVTQTPA